MKRSHRADVVLKKSEVKIHSRKKIRADWCTTKKWLWPIKSYYLWNPRDPCSRIWPKNLHRAKRYSKRLASLNFFMKLVQRLCRTTVEPSFWYEKQIWPTNPPYPWILYAWILCFIAWLSPDYRVRDHEVQLVFTPTTRPSGTPAVAWLPPTKSQTPKPTVQKPLMGLELHVAIVKFAIQPNFQFLHSNFSNPFFYVKIH